MKEFLVKSLNSLVGFITEGYNKDLKPNYIKVKSNSHKNRFRN